MSKSTQVLVKSINVVVGVSREDLGRFYTVVPISGAVHFSTGMQMELFDLKGATLSGTVVNVSERVREGKFPHTEGVVIDTKFTSDIVPERKRMAQGGIQRIQQRTPAAPKPNKRATPDVKRA